VKTVISQYESKISELHGEQRAMVEQAEKTKDSQLQEKDKEILKMKGELMKMREMVDESQVSSKKQGIKVERELIEANNQIRNLHQIIEDLKIQAREKNSIEERLQAKNKEI